MTADDWKHKLAEGFDKGIQATGKHAYRLTRSVMIRYDGKDVHFDAGASFTFEPEDIANIAETTHGVANHHISLLSVTAVTFH
jgi:hypothetical protein